MRPRNWPWVLVVALVAGGYAVGHLLWYRTTPLGQVPVMDEQENLALGESIVRGLLPAEPFYRAPGYALLLAALRALGVSTLGLFSAALALGTLLHALNAALAGLSAARFFGRSAGIAAGLLFALHPVFVHYATQALDATPALTAFLLGLSVLTPELVRPPDARPVPWRWAVASLAWASATALRPNYLLVWGLLGLLAGRLAWRTRRWPVFAGALSGAAVFVALAGWQWRSSGVAGFLPWQGAYNLWVANQPGAHGRYLAQRFTPPAALRGMNPARAESMFLFRQETGHAPADIATLNAHWRGRFYDRVRQDPFGWLLQLARKTYALLNNWEQYNNKTYAFHQARSPWLRWNPIGWGLVALLGLAGGARLAVIAPRAARTLALIGAVSAAALLLFFVSARFRLPLAALGVVLAGGALAAPVFWRSWPHRRQWALAGTMTLAAGLTFSSFDAVNRRATFAEDQALLAGAAFALGDHITAWNEAEGALRLDPGHRNAQRTAVAAYFNTLVLDGRGPVEESRWLAICRRLLTDADPEARELNALAAVALWRAGDRADAVTAWRQLGAVPSAVAARLLVGDPSVTAADLARAPGRAWEEPLVRLAASHLGIRSPSGESIGDPRRAAEIVAGVFGRGAAIDSRAK